MAHTCPFCDVLCHCKGDLDDIDLGFEPTGGCIHYESPDCDYDHNDGWQEDEFDDDDYDDEGMGDAPKD